MNIQELEDKHKEIIGESDLYYPEYLLEGLNKEKIFQEYEKEENLVAKEAAKLSVEFALNLVKEILKTDYEHRAGKAIEIRDKLWDYLTIRLKEGDKCPHCEEGKIIFIKGNEPYDIDHLMCDFCDSTYNL